MTRAKTAVVHPVTPKWGKEKENNPSNTIDFGKTDRSKLYDQLNQLSPDDIDFEYVYVPLTREVLIPWSETITQDSLIESGYFEKENALVSSPFPINDEVNQRLYKWSGDITSLPLDALVISTADVSSNNRHDDSIGARLIQAGGEKFKQTCFEASSTKSGEATISPGYSLPYKHVIHTGCPKYSEKYRTAAENALYNSYRSCLQMAKNKNIQTLGFLCIHHISRQYPSDKGAHIALRTIRRFLENNPRCFQMIVLVVLNDADIRVYKNLIPLYFPRTKKEESTAHLKLPKDVGNKLGEPTIAERTIRVSSGLLNSSGDSNIFVDPSLITSLGFGILEGDHDTTRKLVLSNKSTSLEKGKYRTYLQWVQWSKTEDLSFYSDMKFIYRAGKDKLGRPICVLKFDNLKLWSQAIDLNLVLLQFVKEMDSLIRSNYICVFYAAQDTNNKLDKDWLKLAYDILDERYTRNLDTIYVVQCGLVSRAAAWVLCKSINPILNKKTRFVSLQELHATIPRGQLADQ